MGIADQISGLIDSANTDLKTQEYQKQYSELLSQGIIHRRGYNLADLNVIGDNPTKSFHKCMSNQPFSKFD